MDKNHPEQNIPNKRQTPGQKTREQLIEILYRGLLSGFFVLDLLKIGGSEMCDMLLRGPGMCDKV